MHNARPMKLLLTLLTTIVLGLAGCVSAPSIDTRFTAQGQDSRVLFIVLHYTESNLERALRILTQQQVSAHYLVSDEAPPRIYRLVDESRRAWHAGQSAWKDHGLLNASSIGIEIVNAGGQPRPDGSLAFAPYPPAQVEAVIALVKDIAARHQILPTRILGHSDIAPQRKIDPGPAFPWQRLAEAGLIVWPHAQRVAEQRALHEARPPDVAWFQRALAEHGYRVPEHGALDEPTRRVLAAFQMKYRPARYDGQPDAETAALLDVLNASTR